MSDGALDIVEAVGTPYPAVDPREQAARLAAADAELSRAIVGDPSTVESPASGRVLAALHDAARRNLTTPEPRR